MKNKYAEIGKGIGSGIISEIFKISICIMMLTGILLSLVVYFSNSKNKGLDDSDQDGWHRSGLIVYTDHLTGVQYIGNGEGITPRLRADGGVVGVNGQDFIPYVKIQADRQLQMVTNVIYTSWVNPNK